MILVLGTNGYVGSRYREYLERRRIPIHGLSRADVDYSSRRVLAAFLKKWKPDFVINAAGYTGRPNVDACEKDKVHCLDGNAILPGIVREECEQAGIPWGHVSSGCIFTGRRPDGGGFREDDVPNFCFRHGPCSFYSGTKALGEELLGYRESGSPARWVPEGAPSGYVWRLRIPFDNRDNPRNYLTKLMRYERLLEAENSISNLDDFVEATVRCWEDRVPPGIYNVTNPGPVNTRQVVNWIEASPVGDRLRQAGKKFSYFEDESEFMKVAALTPRSNCVLDSARLEAAGIQLPTAADSIRQALENWIWQQSS